MTMKEREEAAGSQAEEGALTRPHSYQRWYVNWQRPKPFGIGSSDLGGANNDDFVRAKRPSVTKSNSSKVRLENEWQVLKGALEEKHLSELLDTLWRIGIRTASELQDIEWEDVSEEGITKFQLRKLHRLGHEHAGKSHVTQPEKTKAEGTAPGDIELRLQQPSPPASEPGL